MRNDKNVHIFLTLNNGEVFISYVVLNCMLIEEEKNEMLLLLLLLFLMMIVRFDFSLSLTFAFALFFSLDKILTKFSN